jgi:hypothetical protein
MMRPRDVSRVVPTVPRVVDSCHCNIMTLLSVLVNKSRAAVEKQKCPLPLPCVTQSHET